MPSPTLPIVYYDDARLRQKGTKVTVFDHTLRELADAMLETMHAYNGIGLAAQQVGQPIMLEVMDTTVSNDDEFNYELDGKTPPLSLIMPLVLVNPVLKLDKSETEPFEEGCLSFRDVRGEVERPTALMCRYQDLQGNAHTLYCDGLLARIIQHETDHLNGILFIDRMSKSTVKKLWPRLEALKTMK